MKITTLEHIEKGISVSLRCPQCRDTALFHPVGNDVKIQDYVVVGSRRCPGCSEHVFVVIDSYNRSVDETYPPCLIAFDSSDIPEKIVDVFREALKCDASGCHVAAAIMVRRTLEEICADKGAQGGNLKARIADLGTKIVLPKELLDAMDELRLLGNDAAHIEAQEFAEVGPEELKMAIDLTIEIMKGLYQYSSLLTRLKGLKTKNAGQAC